MAIGLGDIVAFLALAGFSAIAWRRQRNVGGKTWAFRIVPLGIILMLVVSSNEAVIACAMLTFAAYAFTAYRGGWRLTWPKNHWLHGVWWMVHVIVYFILISALCFTTASVVRLAVRFSPLPSETWTRGNVSNELPFAVEYKRAKTLCAEYDKRIRFKSGKTVGIWPDTGGGGPFAVYALQDGEYYIVDGIEHDFLRNEYRVNCRNETVELKGKYSWILIPDRSLKIRSLKIAMHSDFDLMSQTADGTVCSTTTTPIGRSLAERRFLGMILTSGRFIAGGNDPLAGIVSQTGEKKWMKVALPQEMAFAIEMRELNKFEHEFRVVFNSGKVYAIGFWLRHPFDIFKCEKGTYVLRDRRKHQTHIDEFRIDESSETMDMRYMDVWLRIPDGSLEITGVLCDGNKASPRYLITVQTENGEIKGSQFEPVTENPEAEQLIGEINANGKFVRKVHP